MGGVSLSMINSSNAISRMFSASNLESFFIWEVLPFLFRMKIDAEPLLSAFRSRRTAFIVIVQMVIVPGSWDKECICLRT